MHSLAGFPFFPTSQEVLPTYVSRIIPGAASAMF
jgi:hypothetical protein